MTCYALLFLHLHLYIDINIAWSGSKHLIHLLDLNKINLHPFPELEAFYSRQLLKANVPSASATPNEKEDINNEKPSPSSSSSEEEPERLLLATEDGQELGKILETPGIAIEVERAVVQIGHKLADKEEKR